MLGQCSVGDFCWSGRSWIVVSTTKISRGDHDPGPPTPKISRGDQYLHVFWPREGSFSGNAMLWERSAVGKWRFFRRAARNVI